MSFNSLLNRSKRWRNATKDPEDLILKKELDVYYQNKDNLNCPKGLDVLTERKWYQREIKILQDQLSPKANEIVLARQRSWQMKLQSSHD